MSTVASKRRPKSVGTASPQYAEDLRLNVQLCFALYTTTHKLTRIYNARLEPFGLTLPQMLVIMALWERSPQMVGEIAEVLDLNNGSITPVLKRLEANGYVRRRRDARDERRVYVELTDKAIAIREPIIAMRTDLVCGLQVADGDIHGLRSALNSFSSILSRVES